MNNEDVVIQNLVNTYFKGSLNFSLSPEDIKLMSWSWQQKFLDATVNSKIMKKYPTSSQFTQLFLKKFMGYLENHQDVHDDFYVELCSAMNNSNEEFCYRHYLINSNNENVISIKETNKMVVNGTTGMRTWEAALMLADWALCNKLVFQNKNILELGSGVGFTGITVAKLCDPKSIYLTDCHHDVLDTIKENIKINIPNCKEDGLLFRNGKTEIGAHMLDWNVPEDISNCVGHDVVIGADIVYDPSILPPLCNVLNILFQRNKQLAVYIASVIRNKETFKAFLDALDQRNFKHQKILFDKNVNIEWDPNTEKCLLKINCIVP